MTITFLDEKRIGQLGDNKIVEADQRFVEKVEKMVDGVVENVEKELGIMDGNWSRSLPVESLSSIERQVAWEVAKKIRTGEFPEKFADKEYLEKYLEFYRADSDYERNRVFKRIVKVEKERGMVKETVPSFWVNN